MTFKLSEALIMNETDSFGRHGEFSPIDSTLKILNGKYKSIILCQLMVAEKSYIEIQKSLSNCSDEILSLQLEQLENDHIIQKEIDSTSDPIKTSYQLTRLGTAIIPVINAMDAWGEMYITAVKNNKE